MKSMSSSFRNLAALAEGRDDEGNVDLSAGGPLSFSETRSRASRTSVDSIRQPRCIVVSNHLPIKATKSEVDGSWEFEKDEDILMAHVQDGVGDDLEVLYVGTLPFEVEASEQECLLSQMQAPISDIVKQNVALELYTLHNCCPVFLGKDLKDKYYKGFCKQQLWPMFHYLLPLMPNSLGRFDAELWQNYVKANKVFADKLVEIVNMDEDYVWIHDYHLLVLPSLLRKRFHRIRCGLFLHCPFPSSEIFRTFPKREELLRSLLNADLIGFHTFDYARHFLSCCSRMLGIEHMTSRGSIMLEYYGRNVGVKIMPTGINPERFQAAFEWEDTEWRRGELLSQFKGQRVLIGVDDMDLFKGIELKLLAVEQVLKLHDELRGRLVLIQITNAPRSSGKDLTELHEYIMSLVERINKTYGDGDYKPVVWLGRPVPLYEKIALYSIADAAVVTASRDGMCLVPYEYIVCRQTHSGDDSGEKNSMLIISEFVGCTPSMSGAIRVNPWSLDDVADGIYSAINMAESEKHLRHDKHWRYVSQHTVKFWVQAFMADLKKFTQTHKKMRVYGLGLGLDSFRMVALMENFRKLELSVLMAAYSRAKQRLFLLDYDGTLVAQNNINSRPSESALAVLRALTADAANTVFIISGRSRAELGDWFSSVPHLGIAAEHGFYYRRPGQGEWDCRSDVDSSWRDMVQPIMQIYMDSTDGSHIEEKESALVWSYGNADPDFGHWQAKELLDHLEGVLNNQPVEVVSGNSIVEVKPQGVSKGGAVDRILLELSREQRPPNFVLCIGDDRSDEDMFTAMEHVNFSPHMPAEVFACTVGQKPSKAPFYLNDVSEVAAVLARLADIPSPVIASPTISMQL